MFLSVLQCQGCALTAAKMSIELQKVLNDTSGPCAAESGTLRNETTCVERKKKATTLHPCKRHHLIETAAAAFSLLAPACVSQTFCACQISQWLGSVELK